jgi:hypothetical protein
MTLATVERIHTMATFQINYTITGSHSEEVEADTLEEAIEKASDQANENAAEIAYDLEVNGTYELDESGTPVSD